MKYQVQVRSLCPEWAKLSKSERNANTHKDQCRQERCGFSEGDYWRYEFVDYPTFLQIMTEQPTEPVAVAEIASALKSAVEVSSSPKRRGRPPKNAAPAATTADPLDDIDPIDVPDPLDADPLDDPLAA